MSISCHLLGGLGNELFEIFTTISYAIQCKQPFYFLNTEKTTSITPRHTYWNTFFAALKPFLRDNYVENAVLLKENEFVYSPLPLQMMTSSPPPPQNIVLQGYFQSYKYFDQYKNVIMKLLKITDLWFKVEDDFDSIFPLGQCASIHFRFGDYKQLTNTYTILPISYYQNAIRYILERDATITTFIYFYEPCTDDDAEVKRYIAELRRIFPTIRFVSAQHNFKSALSGRRQIEDWEEMLLMASCAHNIIANSTFSWWAAYLGDIDGSKFICYPSAWFAATATSSLDTKDLFPSHWWRVQN